MCSTHSQKGKLYLSSGYSEALWPEYWNRTMFWRDRDKPDTEEVILTGKRTEPRRLAEACLVVLDLFFCFARMGNINRQK